MSELTTVPRSLEVDPDAWLASPVESLIQELPFSELRWENFERLCLRLARLDGTVETSRLYGIPGQNQHGIDLYARSPLNPKYRVYQCKREEAFGPAKIKDAVAEFLAGTWVDRTETFVLCTKESLRATQRSEEVEAQREILRAKGIAFEVWDSEELNVRLKAHPVLVDDFFGRTWTKAFCSSDQLTQLGERLDGPSAAKLRGELRTLYTNIFRLADPGFPSDSDSQRLLALYDRYVVPDILEDRIIHSSIQSSEPSVGQDGSPTGAQQSNSPVKQDTFQLRRSVDHWLTENPQSIVLGGPGMGKSALLRFIALDILSPTPRCLPLATANATRLPIWVPFAYWTAAISTDKAATKSLADILAQWLHQLNQDDIATLIKAALRDDRLLLLVDGLDEYHSEESAAIALAQLQVIIAQQGCKIIATCRPVGFERINAGHVGWRTAYLAELSLLQQRAFARIWLQFHLESGQVSIQHNSSLSDTAADSLINEVQRSPGLNDLAGIPLLFGLLIYLKTSNQVLPRSRFQAYEALVNHLISRHPAARRKSAFVTASSSHFRPEDMKAVFAALAFSMAERHSDGNISRADAAQVVIAYLEDESIGFGQSHTEARQHAAELIDVGESNLGIVVQRGPQAYGFAHRIFQEFLAAAHFSQLPIEAQENCLAQRAADPQWREVILCFLYQLNRQSEVSSFVDQLKALRTDRIQKAIIDSILAEIVVGPFKIPTPACISLCQELINEIETGAWLPQRDHLLKTLLPGIYSVKVGTIIQEKIETWYSCRQAWRSGLFGSVARVTDKANLHEALFRGLRDEERTNQRDAAAAIAAKSSMHPEFADRLIDILRKPNPVSVIAAAVEALLLGWIELPVWDEIEDRLRRSASIDLRVLAIRRRILTARATMDDKDELLCLGSRNVSLAWSYKDIISDSLIRGWPGDSTIRDIAIQSLDTHIWLEDGLERDIAMSILLDGYAADTQTITAIANIIRSEDYPFSFDSHHVWQKLAERYVGNATIIAATDQWLTDAKRSKYHSPEVSFASRLGQTKTARAKLLEELKEPFPFWAARALLEDWGTSDDEVQSALKELADSDRAAEIGDILPRLIPDREECFNRLLAMVKDPNCKRPDFVIDGLIAIARAEDEDTVIDLALPWIDRDRWWSMAVVGAIIRAFPTNARVRALAITELKKRDGNFAAIAELFSNDPEILPILLRIATPLPSILRLEIVDFLESNAMISDYCLDLLSHYDSEVEPELKTKSAIAYYRTIVATGRVEEQNVLRLKADIVCVGPDFQERRQAAFCGLLLLNRLDLYLAAREADNHPLPLELSSHGSPNLPLVRFLLSNWLNIQASLGDHFRRAIFGSTDVNDPNQWHELAPIIDEYPEPKEALLNAVHSNGNTQIYESVLQFLGRALPKSQVLLKECLRIINDEGLPTHRWIEIDAAAELLGRDFHGDSEVLAAIRKPPRAPFHRDNRKLWALCEGWPEAEELDKEYVSLKDELDEDWHRLQLGFAQMQLLCAKGSADDVFHAVMAFLDIPHPDLSYSAQSLCRPLFRRIRNDSELQRLLKMRLENPPHPSQAVSIARILFQALSLESDLRSWSDSKAGANTSPVPWPMGTDITRGTVIGEWEAGMEIVFGATRP